ncbi:hypothetical protein MNBD_CHLOROFLEXI01-3940 [hydrothermal vent metagenome]|uniref:Glycosyltransferase 2-like domain-containing protein n=1 Tax=hydrothermal vent metagenome TaxID=652676 RepID=A0A3B0UV24_9ZZZZ
MKILMNLRLVFPGQDAPFEGDRTLLIKGLPVGATIRQAAVSLTPVSALNQELFEEVLFFNGNQEPFGGTKVPGNGFVEVDFHTRRTLAAVLGTNLTNTDVTNAANNAELQVDLGGGVFMQINDRGALHSPEDGADLFTLGSDGVLPGLTASRFSLRRMDAGSMNVSQVTVRTVPTNVNLGLGQLSPFWTRVGEMTQPQTSSNFAEMLQLFLNEAERENGDYLIPLVVHSDALTRLDVTVDIEFVRQTSALPGDVGEVSLPFTHDGVAQTDGGLLQVALPAGAQVIPGETSVRVLGSFDESRVLFGPTGPVELITAVTITPQQGQAHPILLDEDLAVTAVDLLLASVSRAAILDINLLGDVDGKPFADPLLAEPIALELDRDVADTPTWVSVQLPNEFQFRAGERVWLVVQVREGEAAWSAETAVPDAVGLHHTATGGLAWRVTIDEDGNGRLAGLFRLRHTPSQFEMPLEVMVGAGDEALRVSLDRFQPLGRVDFDINFPEFAEAISQVALQTGPTLCPQGEQLQNANLEQWITTSDQIGPVEETPLWITPRTFTIAPNGKWAFANYHNELSRFVSLPFLESNFQTSTSIAPESPKHVAISADSKRIYIVTIGNNLRMINTETHAELPNSVEMDSVTHINNIVSSITLTPDGRRLYIAYVDDYNDQGYVAAVDTAVLEETLSRVSESSSAIFLNDVLVSGDSESFPNPIPLNVGQLLNLLPTSMACTPDGRSLYIATVNPEETNNDIGDNNGGIAFLSISEAVSGTEDSYIHIIDIFTHLRLIDPPIRVGQGAVDMALTPNGQWALSVNYGDNTLTVINTNRLLVEATISLDSTPNVQMQPVDIAISPDSCRAYIANEGNQSISIINLVQRSVERTIVLAQSDNGTISIAITPSADRLYVVVDDAPREMSRLLYLSLGQQQPEAWTLTTGFVMPICFADPHKLTAVLGPITNEARENRPSRPTALSQAVPAVGNCIYDFSFWGIASDIDAVAEVIWQGDACMLQRVDRIPIQLLERPRAQEDSFSTATAHPYIAERLLSELASGSLMLHRIRLIAPAGANQVEIRFLIPPETLAIVDTVSFQATQEAVENSDLRFASGDELVGWRLLPETATGFLPLIEEDGTCLQNAGSADIALVQTFAVTAAQPFILLFEGSATAQLAGQEAAHVELRWLAEGEAVVGEVASLAVTAVDNQKHTLNGTVPTDALSAELHLVIPRNTTVVVSQISFQPVEIVQVPINFIAQAPGKLTISDFQIAYDIPAGIIRPPLPPAGLCQPTPPGRPPGGKPGDACVCPWCSHECPECAAEQTQAVAQVSTRTQAIRVQPLRRRSLAARSGLTESAASNSLIIDASPVPPAVQLKEAVTAVIPTTKAAWVALAGDLAITAVPLTEINGIGPERATTLANMEISTMDKLATADSAAIAEAINGVSLNMADTFIAKAQSMLNNPDNLQVPLVSCVMPTVNRRHFVPQSIAYFLRQDYPNRELIIVDDGSDPIEDLIPDDEQIHYVRQDTPMTVGAKRNLGFEMAGGQILATWDDDVWTADWQLSYQVASLLQNGADICGLDNRLHYDLISGQAWHSVSPPGKRPWLPGNSLCFTRTFWEAHPFADANLGEDIQFVRSDSAAKIVALQAIAFQVDIIHGSNVSPKNSASPLWHTYPVQEIQALMGDDWAFYVELSQRLAA